MQPNINLQIYSTFRYILVIIQVKNRKTNLQPQNRQTFQSKFTHLYPNISTKL